MNAQDPACREAFIAAMEELNGNFDLEWVEYGDDGPSWVDCNTADAFIGFCLAYHPPRDVDPETVLGKLKKLRSQGCRGCGSCDQVPIDDLIDLIESLQRERDEAAEALRRAEDQIDALGGTPE